MKSRRSIELILVGTAFVILLVVVGGVGAWQVMDARSAQRTQIEDGGVNAAHLAASAVGSALSSRLDLLSNLGVQPPMATIFTKDSPEVQAQVAAALHMVYPGFSSFVLIASSGRLDARWPSAPELVGQNLASQPYFQAVLRTGKPYISQGE
jgi:C4-dicarboxylate-specific signal transduction histidine kinase